MKNQTLKIVKTAFIVSSAALMTACGQTSFPLPTQMQTAPQIQVMNQTKEIIVKFTPEASRHALRMFNEKFGLKTVGYIEPLNAYVFKVIQPSGLNTTQTVNAMQAEPIVLYAEENLKMKVEPVAEMGIHPIFK